MEVYIAAGGLAIVILSSAIGVVWKLSRIELSIRADHGSEIAALRVIYHTEISALQTKVFQVEIWARDEFVRKSSFEAAVARLEKSVETLGTKIETSIEKMAGRIEKQNNHQDA